MIKTDRSLTVPIFLITASLTACPVSAKTKSNALHNWYLVDEIIEDEAPDYRSDIFFADKASIKKVNGFTSVSISQIIMATDKEASENDIKDLRSHIIIDCNQHIYAVMEVAEFNKDNELMTLRTMSLETAEWILPFANSGYVSIFRFACEPDKEFGTQKFPSHIQPLAAITDYLNADWSK